MITLDTVHKTQKSLHLLLLQHVECFGSLVLPNKGPSFSLNGVLIYSETRNSWARSFCLVTHATVATWCDHSFIKRTIRHLRCIWDTFFWPLVFFNLPDKVRPSKSYATAGIALSHTGAHDVFHCSKLVSLETRANL
jgi:hypothetical protein